MIRIGTAGNQTAAFLQGVYGKTIGGTTKAVVVNGSGRLGTAPAPAAPALKSQNKTLGRLRDNLREQRAENRQQSAELRQQQRTFTHQIQRLREQVRSGVNKAIHRPRSRSAAGVAALLLCAKSRSGRLAIPATHEAEQYTALPLHYLFEAIPVSGIR